MSGGELFLVLVRWVHALATAVWIGGGGYAIVILGPQLRDLDNPAVVARLERLTGEQFSRWVRLTTVVFIVSGVILIVDRLSNRGATVEYGIVLTVKVGLALWMFAIAQGLGRWRRRMTDPPANRFAALGRRLGSPQMLLWLGAIVVLLAAVLKTLYEAALRGS